MSTSNWQGRDQGIPPVVPIGSMFLWATNTPPQDYLLCNGQAVSRTLFTSLFAVLGTTYGIGDGSTTFNLPNTGGRTVRGVNGTYTNALTGGNDTVTLAANNLPIHGHTITDLTHAHNYSEPNGGLGHQHTASQGGGPFNIVSSTGAIELQGYTENIGGPNTGLSTTGIVISGSLTGINRTNDSLTLGQIPQTQVATNIVNPFIAMNYIIKAQ